MEDLADRVGVEPSAVLGDRDLERLEVRPVGPELSELDGDDADPEAIAREVSDGRFVTDFAAPSGSSRNATAKT